MTPDLLPIEIQKDGPIPIYYQLQRGIMQLIESGAFKPGDSLPSETELSRAYSISPMTVRQAMSELVNRGYIHRIRGRGTFVSPRPLEHPLDQLVGFSEDMRARHMTPGARILLLEPTTPPAELIEQAGLAADAPMTRIKRVRFVGDEPVGVHDAYLHQIVIAEADLARTPSLYQLLGQMGITLGEGTDKIEAVPAGKETAELLRVRAGAPLLRTTRLAWSTTGQFVEYVVALYRADLYQYRVRLKRG
jgi:GntR family transcriptional regulator